MLLLTHATIDTDATVTYPHIDVYGAVNSR